MMLQKTFFALLLSLILAGCGGNLLLDNPRNVPVEFVLDGSSHSVGPETSQSISLDPGNHSVKVLSNNGEVLADTTFRLGEAGVLHSGASTYVVWRQLYGLQKDRSTLLNERWVEFDSIRTYGDFKVYDPAWVYIEKSWDYGLEDPLPDAQSLYITSDFLIESKIFRSKDFVEAYRDLAKGQ